jgi:hypothetical protein
MKIITKEYLYELSGFLGHTIMVTFDPDSESAKIFSNQLIVKLIFTDEELDAINSNLKTDPMIETYGYVKAIEAGSYNLDARQAKLLEKKGFNVEDILNVSTDHLI